MPEFDDAMRDALHQAAEPPATPDASTLADQLRNRAASMPAAAGFGALLPWIAVGLAVVLVAGIAGVLGAFGTPTSSGASTIRATTRGVASGICPGGTDAITFRNGDRVLAVQRKGDAWIAVRNPENVAQLVWVARNAINPDANQRPLTDLPQGGCDTATINGVLAPPVDDPTASSSTTTTTTTGTAPAPAPGPGPSPGPAPAPAPGPAPDTQKPNVAQAGVAPTELCDAPQTGWATTATMSAVVTDNVAVTSVQATWSGLPGSGVQLTKTGGSSWSGTFGPFGGAVPAGQSKNVTITLTARDAAGNTTTRTIGPVRVYDIGSCLF